MFSISKVFTDEVPGDGLDTSRTNARLSKIERVSGSEVTLFEVSTYHRESKTKQQVTFGGGIIIEEDEDSLVKESIERNPKREVYLGNLENCSDPENEEGAATRMD